jgi:hypothetical protein
MGTIAIVIEVDDGRLAGYEDSHLAALWHLAQATPAPWGDRAAGELVERIGRDIIRCWLGTTPLEWWHHQDLHHYGDQLRQRGSGRPDDGTLAARPAAGAQRGPRNGEGRPDCEHVATGRPIPGQPGHRECTACGASGDQQSTGTPPAAGGDR